jgi:3-hydroxybutyryl-CoA dehydratase
MTATAEAQLGVAERFETEPRVLTEADVLAFAELTGDHHPQHVDPEWSRDSMFGQQVAHGMLVLSSAVGLVPFDPERVVALRGVSVTFKRPVAFGEAISVEGQVDSVKPVGDEHALAECHWRIVNQNGKVVARATVEVLVRTQAAAKPQDLVWEKGVVPL